MLLTKTDISFSGKNDTKKPITGNNRANADEAGWL